MMHEPDCPLFLETQTIAKARAHALSEGEGRKKKKTLIRVITDQLPKPRKQFENEKNALKISDDKVVSAINQHLTEAKKKPEKKKPEKKSQKEREVKIQEDSEEDIDDMTEGKKELEKLQEDIDDEVISSADYETKMNSYLAKPMDDFKKWLQQLSSVALLTNKDIPVPMRTKATPGGETYKKFVSEGRADLKGDIKTNKKVKQQDITKYKTIINAMIQEGEIKKQDKPYTFEWIRENYKKLYLFIHKKYTNFYPEEGKPFQPTSFAGNIFLLSNLILHMHTPDPESPKGCLDLARKLISLGWIIVKRVQRKYLNNEVQDKVNFVFYDVAEKTLENLKLEWDKMYEEYKEWFSKERKIEGSDKKLRKSGEKDEKTLYKAGFINKNSTAEAKRRFTLHTQVLALALNVWTAPLRNDLIEAFFIKSNEFPAPYTDKTSTQNSLWFEEERQQWMFVMNKDKLTTRSAVASNKSQQDEMALLGKIPAQEIMNYSERTLFFQKGDAITDLLNQSWEMFPRAYIFPTFESCQTAITGGGNQFGNHWRSATRYGGKPLNAQAYFNILSDVKWADNQPHRPTQNLLRQAHHMYWRGLNAFSTQQYETMALRSRHSLKIADFIYLKRDFREEVYRSPIARLGDDTLYAKVHSLAQQAVKEAVQSIIGDKEEEMKSMTHNAIGRMKTQSERRHITQKKSNAKYFDKGSYGKIRLSDNRYLDYLKKGMIKQPIPSTLAAHGIIEVDGVYQFSEEKKQERERHSAKGSGYQLDEETHKELEEKHQESKKKASRQRPKTAPNIIVSG